MPLVLGAATSKASYGIVDYNGQTARYNISAGDEAKAIAGLQLINVITGAKVTDVTVSNSQVVASGANVPLFGHQREYRCIFECALADGTTGKLILPAPTDTSLLSTDKRYIDLADAAIAAFVTWLVTPANGANIGGKQISGVKQAYVSHKESSVQVEKLKIG
jgi:hypothetical protein